MAIAGVVEPRMQMNPTVVNHVSVAVNDLVRSERRAASILSGSFIDPVGLPYISVTLPVTPGMAKHWLDNYNKSNRGLTRSRVAEWARALRDGRWKLNGQTIAFSVGGRLMNGQHRLHAIFESGITALLLVVFGLEDDTYDTQDIGQSRTGAQIFRSHGEDNAVCLHGICKACCLYESGMPFQSVPVSADEARAFLDSHPEIRDVVRKSRSIPGIRPSVVGCMYYYLSKVDKALCDEMFDRLADGVGLAEGSPMILLRRRLAEDPKRKRKMQAREEAALLIKTWNMLRRGAGQKYRYLAWREDEEFPAVV